MHVDFLNQGSGSDPDQKLPFRVPPVPENDDTYLETLAMHATCKLLLLILGIFFYRYFFLSNIKEIPKCCEILHDLFFLCCEKFYKSLM